MPSAQENLQYKKQQIIPFSKKSDKLFFLTQQHAFFLQLQSILDRTVTKLSSQKVIKETQI